MLADNSGSIELFMAANSLFTGKSETENSGIIDLDMTDSMWRMTGSSSLTNFTNNKSVVDMTKDGGAFSSLTTENLSGNGGFFFFFIYCKTNINKHFFFYIL